MPAIDPLAESSALSRVLIDAVREAGALALDMFGRELKTWTKNGGSPVCEADIAVDRLLGLRCVEVAGVEEAVLTILIAGCSGSAYSAYSAVSSEYACSA